MTASRGGRTATATIALSAVGLVLLAAAAPAPAQSGGNEGLGARVERLDAEVRELSRRLGRARAALRRQGARLARVERRLERSAGSHEAGLRSPDGRFAVDVSNTGVRLRAPSASLSLSPATVTLAGGTGTTLQLAAGRTTLAAPVVSLGGASCPPVVRLGDPLLVQPAGEALQATIAGSSRGVFAC